MNDNNLVKLGDVAHECRLTWSGELTNIPIVGLEHLIPGEIELSSWDSNIEHTFSKKFTKGQVLLGRRRVYLKKAVVAPCDGICSGDITVIESTGGILPELLPFVIQNDRFFDYAMQGSAGSLSPRVKWERLKNYEFSLPSLAEQKVLADKLWAAYRLKESYKKLLTATEEMVKSQFIEMFTDKGYPLTMIKSFADVSTGGTPSKAHPEYWNGDKPWVSAEDMKSKYVYDTCEKVTEAGYATCKIIPVDTLMYVCRGSIGVMAINKIECATNQSICRATCHNNVCNVEFLYHALMYQRDNIKKKGTGTSFKSLNQTTFSELEIELPPYDEQMKFVTIAEHADKSGFDGFKSQFIEMFGDFHNKVQIKDVCLVVSGKSIPTKLEDIDGNNPYIKVADFNIPGNEKYITIAQRYVSDDSAFYSKQIPEGSVIFAKNGAASMSNKKRLTKIRCCIDMNTMAVFPKNESILSDFLFATIEAMDVSSHVRQGAIPSISPKSIEDSYIAMPTMEEQYRYVSIAKHADKSGSVLQHMIAC